VIGFFQLNCQYAELCSEAREINYLQNQSGLSDLWMRTINKSQNKFNQIDLTLKSKSLEQTEQIVTIDHIILYLCSHYSNSNIMHFVIECKFIRLSSVICPNKWHANTYTDLSMSYENILSYCKLFKR